MCCASTTAAPTATPPQILLDAQHISAKCAARRAESVAAWPSERRWSRSLRHSESRLGVGGDGAPYQAIPPHHDDAHQGNAAREQREVRTRRRVGDQAPETQGAPEAAP